MTPERFGAQARPGHSGSSTIVSLPDMPSTDPHYAETLHQLVLHSLDEDQAQDVVSIPLEGKSSIADYLVVASGGSTRQVVTMATKLAERLKQHGLGTPLVEGLPAAFCVLIDAVDVVVHLLPREVRGFYNLDRLWGSGDETPEL